jgi:folate-dependent phosphoribosylglycinamide formyltransferase PurN
MKIALLSGGISNSYAAGIILKLKQQGDAITTIIITKPDVKKIRILIAKSGLNNTARKAINYILFKQGVTAAFNNNSHLRDYFLSLNCNPDTNITLKRIIKDNRIPHIFVKNINEEKSLAHLRLIKPDVVIFAGGGIVRKKLIAIPSVGVLNAHMGLLPHYKGMNVLEWSLFNHDPLGITIHFIDEGIDTGDILLKKTIPIDMGDTIQSLRDKSIPISIDVLAEVISGLKNGAIRPVKQEEMGKQYFVMHKRLKDVAEERLQQRLTQV